MTASDSLTARHADDEGAGRRFGGHGLVDPEPTVDGPAVDVFAGNELSSSEFAGNEFAGAAVGGRNFRAALGRFATGITVVTMLGPSQAGEPEPFGITVNAFLSLSLDPPLVAVSIDKRARAHKTLVALRRFGVSVLSSEQAPVSDHFAGRPVELGGVPYEEYEGFPVIRGAIAQLVLRTEQQVDVGDHTLFVGRVEALRYADGAPLIYFSSAYRRLPEP